MATFTSWVELLTTDTDPATEGTQVAGAIYPMVGTEGWLLLIAVVIWLGWHIATNAEETDELKSLSRKRPGSNAHKSNITEW